MSEKVIIWVARFVGSDDRLLVESIEGERTAKQIRTPPTLWNSRYDVHDPEKANYTEEDALASATAAATQEKQHAEWMLKKALNKLAAIDAYRFEQAS